MEGSNPLESDEHEIDNLGSKEEVELLQEGLSFGIKFQEVPKSLAKKDVILNFCIKML